LTSVPATAGPEQRVFRASTPRDAEVIAALFRQANLPAPASTSADSPPAQGSAAIRSAVCELEGRVVGVLEWRDLGEEFEILELAVDPAVRRRGHASFLVASLLRQVTDAAKRPVHLEVRESNAAAIALYTRSGFAVSGRRRSYYRHPEEDALLMSRAAAG